MLLDFKKNLCQIHPKKRRSPLIWKLMKTNDFFMPNQLCRSNFLLKGKKNTKSAVKLLSFKLRISCYILICVNINEKIIKIIHKIISQTVNI